jgi:hypothetical protein
MAADTSIIRSPPVAAHWRPSSLSDRKVSTPAQARPTPTTCPRVRRSSPAQCRISSVNTGPQAMISALENAVDQWMPKVTMLTWKLWASTPSPISLIASSRGRRSQRQPLECSSNSAAHSGINR